jgi:hypothetical protein
MHDDTLGAGFGPPHEKICQMVISERTGKFIDADTLRGASVRASRFFPI